VTGLTAVLSLAGPQAEKFGELIKSMGLSAGSVAPAYDKMANALELVSQRVANAFTALLTKLGDPLLQEFGGIANAISKIFAAIGEGAKDGGLNDLAKYIEGVFQDVQKSLEAVAKNLPAALATADFSGFKNGIEAVLEAVKGLFGGLDLTSVEGLKAVIEAAGLAFFGLSKYVSGVIEAFEPLFNTLVAVGKGAEGVDLQFLELAGNLGGIATQLNVVLPLFTGLLTILTLKQGLGLVSELKLLPAALSGAAAAAGTAGLAGALGTAGLAGAFGLAGYNLGNTLNPAINAFLSKLTGSETTLGAFIYDLIHAAEEAKKLGLGTKEAAQGTAELKNASDGAANAMTTAREAFRKTELAAQYAGEATKYVGKYALETVPIYDKLTGAITGYEQQLVRSAKGTIDLGNASSKTGADVASVAKNTEKAQEAVRKWNEEVAKMAFQEKLALIDAATKTTTAQIEAMARTSVAAFDSISVSIKSTGDVLAKLFSGPNFNEIDWDQQRLIEKQIEIENALRKEAFELQKKLTEAQIAQINAQVDALTRGDGMIKITGDGLEPHLEAFMWQILKNIQTRVNSDGLKLLLGV